MLEKKELNFLDWLIKRLVFKHGYSRDNIIIRSLYKIFIKHSGPFSVDIDKKQLDLILSKYYADFYLDDCGDLNIGYSEYDRDEIRKRTIEMVNDIINKNVPKEPLIKG